MSHPEYRPLDRSLHQILVVDDDPTSRYVTTRLLGSAGFRTLEAASGAEGLLLATEAISAMVLDVHLPDMDGYELCRRLRSEDSTLRLPVLHLTAAYVRDEDKVKGLDSGADAYLTHPVEPAVLVATVQALVRAHAAEGAMRRSEAKFRAIYDQVPAGICLLDQGGRFLDGNPAMLSFLQRPAAEVMGACLLGFVTEAGQAQASRLLARLPATPGYAEFGLARSDGSTVVLGWQISPHVEPGVSMLLANDITARLQLEDSRLAVLAREREARSAAEGLSRMKDEFIAVLSHELRTPLAAIAGWVHVLKKTQLDPVMLKRATEAIERNSELQATLIADLLDMSRMTVGKMRLELSEVDIAHLVESAVASENMTSGDKGYRLELQVQHPVPALRADPKRLQQVLFNIIGNALKFSPAGSPVRVAVAGHADGAVITVTDHGQGIDPAFLPSLFERFSQADATSSRQRGGLGLGLSIARHLVEAHGGTITARSEGLGRGASFEIRLPLEAPQTDVALRDSQGAGEHGGEELARLDVLVVEDDPDMSALLQIILGDRGAKVRVARDHDSALAMWAARAPDILLSDIGLPGKDGYALIREIRHRQGPHAHVPAIALTSFTSEQDRRQALAAGFDAHCPKPLQPLRLVHEIQRLGRRAALPPAARAAP